MFYVSEPWAMGPVSKKLGHWLINDRNPYSEESSMVFNKIHCPIRILTKLGKTTQGVDLWWWRALLGCWILFFMSCSPRKQSEFFADKCHAGNLNCAEPSLSFNSAGAVSDQSEVQVGLGRSPVALVTKSLFYGDSTSIEIFFTNIALTPLHDLSANISPGDTSMSLLPGVAASSCFDRFLFYSQQCSLILKYQAGTSLPPQQSIQLKFKTLLGQDLDIRVPITPGVLMPDFFINQNNLQFESLLVHAPAQVCTAMHDLTVYNYGSETSIENLNLGMTVAGSSDFIIQTGLGAGYCNAGDTIAAQGGFCKIRVCFKPSAPGRREGNLVLSGAHGIIRQYLLSGIAKRILPDQSNVDFGTLATGASPTTRDIVFTIPDDGIHSTGSQCRFGLTGSAQFVINNTGVTQPCNGPLSLAAGSSCNLRIQYTPFATEQTDSASLQASCDALGGDVTVPLFAESTSLGIRSEKSILIFENVLVGGTSTQSLLTSNTAVTSLTHFSSGITEVVGSSIAYPSTSCTGTLGASSSCTHNFLFSPRTTSIDQNAVAVFTAGGDQEGLGRNIPIMGFGLSLVANMKTASYGSVLSGQDRLGPLITFQNPSTTMTASGCLFDSSLLAGSGFSVDANSTCLAKKSLEPQEVCTLQTRFWGVPALLGTHSAWLSMSCAIGGSAQVNLLAEVVNELSLAALPWTVMNFENRLVGISDDVEFTMSNQSGGPTVTGVSVLPSYALPSPSSWSRVVASQTDCSTVAILNNGELCAVRMRFAPSATAGSEQTGTYAGILNLSAAGVDPLDPVFNGVAAKVTGYPSTLDFAVVPTGVDTFSTKSVVISNPSSKDAASGCSLIVDPNFSLFNNTCRDNMAPGESCSYQVKVNSRLTSADLAGYADFVCTLGGQARVSLLAQVKKAPQLSWNPSSFDFGNVDVAATPPTHSFRITHNGTNFLDQGANPLNNFIMGTGFAISSSTCTGALVAGGFCDVTVTFTPHLETSYAGNLSASASSQNVTAAAALQGRGTAIHVVPSPTSLDMGNVDVSSTATSTSVVLTNTATVDSAGACDITAPINYSIINNQCGSHFSLAPGASCFFKVQFAGSAVEAAYPGTVAVSCAPGVTQNIPVTITVKDLPNLAIVSGSLDFSFQDTDAGSYSQTLTLQNQEASAVTLTSLAVASNSGAFLFLSGGTCTATTVLAAGASCTLRVSFDPSTDSTASGGDFAYLKLGTQGFSATLDFLLTGTGSTMNLIFASTNLNFLPRDIGQSGSQSQNILVTNSGTRSAALTYSTLTNPPFARSGTCSASLAVGASCNLTISASAAAVAAVHSVNLTVNETNHGFVRTATVSINGETRPAPVFRIKDNRASTAFGATISSTDITGAINDTNNIANLTPAYRDVLYTLTNSGLAGANSITLPTLALTYVSGATSTMSLVADNCSGSTLAASDTCTFSVRYTPMTNNETSTYSTSITAISAASGVSATVTVDSIVGTSVTAPQLTIGSTSLVLTPTLVNGTFLSSTYTLTNTGMQTATLVTEAFTAGDTSAFSITNNTCPGSLAHNSNCTFKITFTPNASTAYSASLSLAALQSAASVNVTVKGAGYREKNMGSNYSGSEGDLAADASMYFIASRLGDGNTDNFDLMLTLCQRNSNGMIDVSQCQENNISVLLGLTAGTNNFAGNTAGSGPRIRVDGNRIVMLVQNMDAGDGMHGEATNGTATIVVCEKPLSGFVVNVCRPFNIAGDGTQTGKFGSLYIETGRLVTSSQSATGVLLTACDFLSPYIVDLSSCQNTHLGTNSTEANMTDLLVQDNKVYVSAFTKVDANNGSVKAAVCDLSVSNIFSCGSFTVLDSNNGPSGVPPGLFPSLVVSGADLYVAYQYGEFSQRYARLIHCTLNSATNSITPCSLPITLPGGVGSGYSPRMAISGIAASGRLYISSCQLSGAINCSLNLWVCSLTSGVPDCGTSVYFNQNNPRGYPVYSRSILLDLTNYLLVAPYNNGIGSGNFTNGIFEFGLVPER